MIHKHQKCVLYAFYEILFAAKLCYKENCMIYASRITNILMIIIDYLSFCVISLDFPFGKVFLDICEYMFKSVYDRVRIRIIYNGCHPRIMLFQLSQRIRQRKQGKAYRISNRMHIYAPNSYTQMQNNMRVTFALCRYRTTNQNTYKYIRTFAHS